MNETIRKYCESCEEVTNWTTDSFIQTINGGSSTITIPVHCVICGYS